MRVSRLFLFFARSAHSNAYFYGFWNSKCIVLFDTLLEKGLVPERKGNKGAAEEKEEEDETKEAETETEEKPHTEETEQVQLHSETLAALSSMV